MGVLSVLDHTVCVAHACGINCTHRRQLQLTVFFFVVSESEMSHVRQTRDYFYFGIDNIVKFLLCARSVARIVACVCNGLFGPLSLG